MDLMRHCLYSLYQAKKDVKKFFNDSFPSSIDMWRGMSGPLES